MKIKWNQKYTTIAVYTLIVVGLSIVLFRISDNIKIDALRPSSILAMLTPVFIGFAIAYIVNLLLRMFEKRLGKNESLRKHPMRLRAISLLISYLVFLSIAGMFITLLLPRLIDSIGALASAAPGQIRATTQWVEKTLSSGALDERVITFVSERWNDFVKWATSFASNTLPMVGSFLLGMVSNVINFFLGFILSIYLLLHKEQYGAIVNKMLFAILPISAAQNTIQIAARMDNLMRKYIKAQVLVAFILASLFFVVMILMKIPYAFLLAFILFITDMIPIVGPWIGSIPVVLIIFLSDPVKGLWFILVILVGQQLEGNVLSPRIQGQQLGISPFWILLSLIIANHFFGLMGMIVGLPVFVLIYSIVRDAVNARLKRRGLSVMSSRYHGLSEGNLPVVTQAVDVREHGIQEAFEDDDSSRESAKKGDE